MNLKQLRTWSKCQHPAIFQLRTWLLDHSLIVCGFPNSWQFKTWQLIALGGPEHQPPSLDKWAKYHHSASLLASQYYFILVHIHNWCRNVYILTHKSGCEKKRYETVNVWRSKPMKMWQWFGEDFTIVSYGICYDGYKVATTKIVLSINFTNAKWWKYNCSN